MIDEEINRNVMALFHYWKDRSIPGVMDIIPSYSSLTLTYDAVLIRNQNKISSAFEFMKRKAEDSIKNCDWKKRPPPRLMEIPICYHLSLAPDLKTLAAEKSLSVEEVIQLHSDKTYRVYMIGFLPGFAYMGKVDARIALPRKSTPRILVPAGSVGIAGEQTGIYPLDSPGGWNIIGQTPLKLFDPEKDDSVLLRAGDEVKFTPVSLKEFIKQKELQSR